MTCVHVSVLFENVDTNGTVYFCYKYSNSFVAKVRDTLESVQILSEIKEVLRKSNLDYKFIHILSKVLLKSYKHVFKLMSLESDLPPINR